MKINKRVFELNTIGESGSSNEFVVGSTKDGESFIKIGGAVLLNDGTNKLKIDGVISSNGTPTSSNDLTTVSYVANNSSVFYKHHFDLNLTGDQIGQDPSVKVVLNFNCLSNNDAKYDTLSDLEGDGYIVAAFGYITEPIPSMSYAFEAKLVYQGNILVQVYDLSNNTVQCILVLNMGSYKVFDSVTKI